MEFAARQSTVEAVLGCRVHVTRDPILLFTQLEDTLRFDDTLQHYLRAEHLSDLAQRLRRDTVYELRDRLGATLSVFWCDDSLVVIGPYTDAPTIESQDRETLRSLGASPSLITRYRIWRAGLPIVDSEFVMRSAAVLAGSVSGQLGFERVALEGPTTLPAPSSRGTAGSYSAIADRYASEQALMRAVSRGDEAKALAALRRLSTVPASFNYLSIPYLAPTILRIMCRIAAQRGGLAPTTIEAVSQSFAQRLHRVGLTPGRSDKYAEVDRMVREFCTLVRQQRALPYTPLVRKAVSRLTSDLVGPPTQPELAANLKISSEHLGRRFKSETGLTISQFLARERISAATTLLTETDDRISDIAAATGYLDANYFVKVFRSVTGMTPTEYRRTTPP
ncbi:helix-turn-helix domain-containing protein [Microbacterium sp. P5_E9]